MSGGDNTPFGLADKAEWLADGTRRLIQATAENGEPIAEELAEESSAWPTEIWLLLALIIVIAGAWRPIARSLGGSLDKRSQGIRTELEEAQKLREEAQAALASYQRKQRDAMEEAEKIIAHARDESENMRKAAIADLENQLQRREQQAMDRIAQAEQAAAAEVRFAAVDAAVAAARQVLADKLSDEQRAELVDQSIKDVGAKLH